MIRPLQVVPLVAALLLLGANESRGVSVEITEPLDGTVVIDTLVIAGTSDGATFVSLDVDGEPGQAVNGVAEWSVVIEPGSLTPGVHLLTARAGDGDGNEATDSITIQVELIEGSVSVSYTSSVDGTTLTGELYLPLGFDAGGPPVPLVVVLHGGGGNGQILTSIGGGSGSEELDARGWIGIGPDGRAWGLTGQGCPWATSVAYVDSFDPDVGPGEQDVLDFIDWAAQNYPIDPDRIYLAGASMGGRGTYAIGLKNPDRFAAIGPSIPATDMFEIFVRRPEPRECKEGIVGGRPGDSPIVDTMYRVTSGRFLLENALNLPVFHSHGTLDQIALNVVGEDGFLHGWHLTSDGSWDGCHSGSTLCFGHTPTLAELSDLHPEGYDWAFLFSPVGHSTDPRWITGTPVETDLFGVEDPEEPGNLLGMMEFFSRHTLAHDPQTVVFKTYEDQHRVAYWLELDISTPWLDLPGAVRATREPATNSLQVELIRTAGVTFDLDRAGLGIREGDPMTVTVRRLEEPSFDPALLAPEEPLAPTLTFLQEEPAHRCALVTVDGALLSPEHLVPDPARVIVGPLDIDDASRTLLFQGIDSLEFDCDGDQVTPLQGDCNDLTETVFPGAPEICDRLDNDCGGVIDEGFDIDLDGAADCSDTCPALANPDQADADGDGIGDACEDPAVNADLEPAGSSQGRVDGLDLFVLARTFGSCLGTALFDARADLDRDGCVDGGDLALMGTVWGDAVP